MEPSTSSKPPSSSLNSEASAHRILVRHLHLIPIATTTASKQLVNTHCRLIGYNLAETTGSAGAVIDLYDGHDTGGVFVAEIDLVKATSVTQELNIYGWPITAGLYLSVASGSVKGSVTIMYYQDGEGP